MPVVQGGMMAVGAGLGAWGGSKKSGPDFNLSAYGLQAQQTGQSALQAYQNLVGLGPNGQDVTASLNATRNYANTLQNTASGGLYNMGMGNQLAEQQFAGQRLSLEQNFQDQLAQANRAASMSGRAGNDPILRARLAQEQTRQQALLQANQSAAAVDLGRQYTTDSLGLQGQAVNTLAGLASQAYGNQQNLFSMGQQAYGQEFSQGLQKAQYEMSRGGGLKGAITGALTGLGAGAQAAQGFGGMSGGGGGAMQGFQFGAASAGTQAAMGGFGQLAGMNGAPQQASYNPMGGQVFQSSPQALQPSGQFASLSSMNLPMGFGALANSRNGYGVLQSSQNYSGGVIGPNSYMYK